MPHTAAVSAGIEALRLNMSLLAIISGRSSLQTLSLREISVRSREKLDTLKTSR